MNQTYTLTSPLLRPGVTLSVNVSSSYVAGAYDELLEKVREINEIPETEVEFILRDPTGRVADERVVRPRQGAPPCAPGPWGSPTPLPPMNQFEEGY